MGGRPRWTAYLLWSTRRRKELTNEKEDYTFAQIGRVISDEWKKVEGEPLEKLKEEAERLNFEGVKKLPKEGGGGSDSDESDGSQYSEDDDPSFDKKGKKPITLKIKREASTRESRSRKRPSFFQEYENEEDNLDKILDEFEQEQILEQRKPREAKPKKEPKNPGSRPRKRKPEPSYQEDDGDVELETSRSGRVRKIRRRKVFAFGDEDNEESNSDGEDRDEYQPDSGPSPDEEEETGPSDAGSDNDNDENGYKLPLKKRKAGQPMTKEDIERAKKAAFAAKPQIVVDSKKLKKKDYRDEIDSIIKPGEEDYADFSDDELSQVLKMQNIKKEPAPSKERVEGSDDEDAAGSEKAASPVPEDVSLNTPVSNPDAGDGSDAENNEPEAETNNSSKPETGNEEGGISGDIEEGGDLEGSVTAESPVQNFDSDEEDNVNENDTMDKSVPVNGSHETGSSAEEQTGNGSYKPVMKETSAEEDLLTSTEATSMEEGDEQYKNMIAETQMENIFN